MSTSTQPEKHTFQAEVQQLLDIVINSLYTDREIFVRELVSNASDALEKLRHIQLTEKEVFDDRLPLEINISTDDKANTITIQDFGVGMTHDEVVQNLGTIAHSGSKAFLQALKESGAKGENLIGQFGVGFYSAFMAARRVRVYTRSWRKEETGWCWTSEGAGSYELEAVEGQRRGCKIVVELKDDCREFAGADRVREILRRYSSFVQFPINLNGDKVNTVQALWLRNKKEITDEEYTEFYKFAANAYDEPRYRLHFSADAPIAINSLLFVPRDNPERLGFGRVDPGVALYCRKILIDHHPKGLLPEWLRFLKGVVDSEDLPLNISRESMQDSALVQKLNRLLTKRFLKFLEEEADKRPDGYAEFFDRFGFFLKEGAATDFTHREQLTKLLRFESNLTEAGQGTRLNDYISRMKDGQEEIYYLSGPSRDAIERGPYLEAFKARNLEVLYLYEPVDEFVMNNLHEFEGKKFASADQADLKLGDKPATAQGEALAEDETRDLCRWMRDVLGERVADVNPGERLVESPALVLNADKMMTPTMRRMMQAMNQEFDDAVKVNLEINPRHGLIRKIASLRRADEDLAKLVAEQIFDNALISAGLLEDPRGIVERVYRLLEAATEKGAAAAGNAAAPPPPSSAETGKEG